MAKLFDSLAADGTPIVRRPPIPEEQRDAVVRYLEEAPIVLSARGFDVDRLDPERAANVPLTYHTDGTWVWPGAVGYYLRKYGVPPEPELVNRIRGANFRVPEVSEEAQDLAVEVITQPDPPPAPAPAPAPPPAPAPAPAHQFPAPPPPYPAASPAPAPPQAFSPSPPQPSAPPVAAPPVAASAVAASAVAASANQGLRVVVSVLTVIGAIALLIGGKAASNAFRRGDLFDGNTSSSGQSSATSPAVRPGAPSPGQPAAQPTLIESLPDICGPLIPVLPPKARPLKLKRGSGDDVQSRSCRWRELTSDKGRDLSVEVETNTRHGREEALTTGMREFQRMWEDAGDPEFRKSRERLQGLGDEAFASHDQSPIVSGPSEAKAKSYWLGGATVGVRKGNVTIEVSWTAADSYRARGKALAGKNLPYPTAKREAIELARTILAQLH